MRNVFDWVKEITTKKRDWKSFSDNDWKVFDSYMVHRILSMNPDLIEICNLAQNFPIHEKERVYNFYKEYVPKNNRWYKYIKPIKSKYTKELVEHIIEFCESSHREAIEALDIISSVLVENILKARGLDKKEIKKLLK